MPWRTKLGRTAHKCFGGQHRFDVEAETGRALRDNMRNVLREVIRENRPSGNQGRLAGKCSRKG